VARRVVLLTCSRAQRLEAWQSALQSAGYLTLAAPTPRRALHLAGKIRPALVLVEAGIEDGSVRDLVNQLRATPALERVPIVVVGELGAADAEELARDPHAMVRQVDDDVAAIADILHEVVGGPRPVPRRGTQ
jgi:PleD family two-component response regulator